VFDVWFGALRHGYRFARLAQADALEEKGYHLAAQALRSEPVVACSYVRALAVTADGRVATWGRTPYRTQGWPYVRKPDRLLRGVRAVAAGAVHYLALTGDGRVVAWGDNDLGRCRVPADLPPVEAVAAGSYHSLALTTDGRVVTWGSNVYCQRNVPPDLPPVVAVTANSTRSLALTVDGDVVVWGGGSEELAPPAGLKAVAVAAGHRHALAVTPEGRVVAWGSDRHGQPNNWSGQLDVPPDLPPAVAVAAGTDYSVALTVTGDVVVWGRPRFTRGVPPGLKAVAVVACDFPLLAVTPEGRVAVWSNDASDPLYAVPPGLTVRTTPSGTPAGNA